MLSPVFLGLRAVCCHLPPAISSSVSERFGDCFVTPQNMYMFFEGGQQDLSRRRGGWSFGGSSRMVLQWYYNPITMVLLLFGESAGKKEGGAERGSALRLTIL